MKNPQAAVSMRLTKVFGFVAVMSALAVFGQTNAELKVTGYPQRKFVKLTLEEAIQLALKNNLPLQIERYNPLIIAYNVRSLIGAYYDPTFTSQVGHSDSEAESGGFNPITGAAYPGSESHVNSYSGGLGGYLPTGMRYDFFTSFNDNKNTRPIGGTNLGTFTSETWNSSAGVRVTQPLLRDFWTDISRTSIKLRRKDKLVADLRLEQLVHDLVRDVVRDYFDYGGGLEAVKVAEADLQLKEQNLAEVTRKVQVGTVAPLAQDEATADVAAARIALVNARNNAATFEATLKSRIHDDFGSRIGVTLLPADALMVIPVMLDLPTSLHTAMDKRPNLQAERELVARQNIALKYSFNQLFPRLDVYASWGVNGLDETSRGAYADLIHREFPNDSYGLALSTPLTFMRDRANHRAAKLVKEQLVLGLKGAEESVIYDVDTAIRNVNDAYRRVQLSRDSVTAAERNLDAQQRTFAVGKTTSFFVLEAATRLTQARYDEIKARVDYNKALNELARAEGTILEQRKIDFETVRFPARQD
jgi:outer membrane protein